MIDTDKVFSCQSNDADEDTALFCSAMRDVAPLPPSGKALHSRPPRRPIPMSRQPANDGELWGNALSDHIPRELEAGEGWAFLRPGVSRQTFRRLRRKHWGIQAQLDLHGFTREQARMELVDFLDSSNARGFRCVRVVHGKGLSSKSGEPVLKSRMGNWLSQRADVLAFCQAKPEDGGGGAILVLLKVYNRESDTGVFQG